MSMRKIDCHVHLGYAGVYNNPYCDIDSLVQIQRSLGVDTMAISAFPCIRFDFACGNDTVLSVIHKYPDMVKGYIVLSPYDEDKMLPELERCVKDPGMVGIKLHPGTHQTTPDDPRYFLAYEFGLNNDLPVLVHTWGDGDVAAMDRVAERYPGIKLIMAHAGAFPHSMRKAFEVVKRHPNVYVDTALSYTYERNLEWMVENIGSKKILYGSDAPTFDPRPDFGRLELADLPVEDKENIFGKNFLRLFSRA